MDYRAHCEAVERDTAALVEAIRRGDLAATVPTCPDWTLGDLAGHVGEFTGVWAHVLCEGTGRPKTPYAERPDGDAGVVADWYAELAGHLLAELAATPADTEVWTWVPDDKSARFVARRCANELAVHRYDAQAVTGTTTPIDAAVAADVIDETFVMIPAWGNEPDGSGRSLHLHATDHPYECTITMTPQGLDVRREHAAADLTLSAAASDLALLVFQRPPIGTVERDGDPAALDAWYREFHFG